MQNARMTTQPRLYGPERSRFAALAVLAAALIAGTAAGAPAKPDAAIAVIAAAPIKDLTVADAYPAGELRWLLWSDGAAADRAVHLALYRRAGGAAVQTWANGWRGAYDPALRQIEDWRYAGHPVSAVTMQRGAATAQLDLYGLNAADEPVRLAEKSATSVSWAVGADGKPVLILYAAAAGGTLTASCYAWNGELAAFPCP
jgi:hypothetical protein